MSLPRVLLSLLPLFLCHCATLRTQPSYSGFGEADLARDASVVERFQTARAAAPPDVKVLVDTLPEGLVLDNGVLRTEEGYAHAVLGRFQLKPQSSFYSVYWFADYQDEWRKSLCYPQVPLVWLTGSIWFLLPPFYACLGKDTQPRALLLEDTRRMTHAAGGDLAILHFGQPGPQGTDEAFGAEGYVLKMDPEKGTGTMRPIGPRAMPTAPRPGAR